MMYNLKITSHLIKCILVRNNIHISIYRTYKFNKTSNRVIFIPEKCLISPYNILIYFITSSEFNAYQM